MIIVVIHINSSSNGAAGMAVSVRRLIDRDGKQKGACSSNNDNNNTNTNNSNNNAMQHARTSAAPRDLAEVMLHDASIKFTIANTWSIVR